MSDLPWFKLWPSDVMDCQAWRKLSLEERGLLMIAFSCLAKARSEGRQASVEDVAHYAGCRAATAEKILAKLSLSGYLVVEKLQLSSSFFDSMQKSKDATAAERMSRYRDSHRNVTRTLQAELRVEARSKKQEADIGANAPYPPSAPPSVKPKATKIPDELPEVTFDAEDELRVTALLLQHAPSGRVQPRTLARLRVQFRAKFDAVGAPSWRYGVDTALAKPAGWPYALSVMANNPSGPPIVAQRSVSSATGRYVPVNLRPDAELLAQLDQIGKRHAIQPL